MKMYRLIIKDQPLFEGRTVEKVKQDYFDFYVLGASYPVIDRIEVFDENDNLVKLILGDLFYDDLVESMLLWKREAEVESRGYREAQRQI